MDFPLKLFAFFTFCQLVMAAPISDKTREGKSIGYFDYIQPVVEYAYEEPNDFEGGFDDNEISRTVPKRKRIKPRPQFDSPIYYIRLPPQPYMFVPGLGYVSQPAPPPVPQLLNVPVSFVANGKPSNIYQWSGAISSFPEEPVPQPPMQRPMVQRPVEPQPMVETPKPTPTNSKIHRLPGSYMFNGKPNDIFVLRDSYNSLYSDTLQNFYP